VVDETVIEIFTAKMGITNSGLDLENTFFDGEERHVESSSNIEDGDISLADDLVVKSVIDGSSSRFIGDMEDAPQRWFQHPSSPDAASC
jgi:hypothetical protein